VCASREHRAHELLALAHADWRKPREPDRLAPPGAGDA